ncbi:ABATE domain-containing protein [Saccharothrix australiensis]|uniref:Putative RNA-binding Zn ribbon-like protein n=1 Tax=Saccharothrix australiensis TaxID=2072 RepID=A0A495W2G0_9PSEU|nr:ABATE domain-containing protein [Saccharothrix australiensis]RKT55881.1 putative RNA-binding Zn ribbon-like protein [Saccharothrix australiensis]
MSSDEPRPVRLMNTVRADRSGVRDHLTTAAELTAWLGAPADARDLAAFRVLRRALRDLAAELTGDTRPVAADRDPHRAVGHVNDAVGRADSRPRLALVDGEPRRRPAGDASPAARALAGIAAEAVELFTGPDRALLRACHAPGCVLYFVRDHPRREWCSPACGNRARAARHYRRVASRRTPG